MNFIRKTFLAAGVLLGILMGFLLRVQGFNWCLFITVPLMMMFFTGWLTYYIHPSVYIKTVAIGVISYLFIHVLQLRRIKKVPMGEVLKGME